MNGLLLSDQGLETLEDGVDMAGVAVEVEDGGERLVV
jgi:hypothetical protein